MLYLFSSGLCVIYCIQHLMSMSLIKRLIIGKIDCMCQSWKKVKSKHFFLEIGKNPNPRRTNQNLGFAKSRTEPEGKNVHEPEMNWTDPIKDWTELNPYHERTWTKPKIWVLSHLYFFSASQCRFQPFQCH